jgi:hypothetical protein
MTPTSVVVAGLLFWIASELVAILFIRSSRRKLRHFVRVENARSRFASARQNLFSLVLRGELSPESETFHRLHKLQTFILRRPDQYAGIRDVLASEFLRSPPDNEPSEITAEASAWSEDTKQVVRETARALALIIFDYSPLRLWIWQWQEQFRHSPAHRHLRGKASKAVRRFLELLASRREPDASFVPTVRQAQDNMMELASC